MFKTILNILLKIAELILVIAGILYFINYFKYKSFDDISIKSVSYDFINDFNKTIND